MRICSLSSGSKGNCIYVDTPEGSFLVDVGITHKQLICKAKEAGIDLKRVKGILITHEHTDHIKGLITVSKELNVPAYIHPLNRKVIGGEYLYAGDNSNYELGFDIGGTRIQPFRTPHDAKYSVGYKISFEGKSVAIATDLGFVTGGVFNTIAGSSAVVLESNHDVEMLKKCRYPYPLKERILSNTGHLSNTACADAVERLVKRGTDKFILGHLSEESNLPELALRETENRLKELRADHVNLNVAKQREVSDIIEV